MAAQTAASQDSQKAELMPDFYIVEVHYSPLIADPDDSSIASPNAFIIVLSSWSSMVIYATLDMQRPASDF